jgi:serine/threonine-protein kinase
MFSATTDPVSAERSVDASLNCPNCGASLPVDAKFCPFDGADVVGGQNDARHQESLVGIIVDERYEVLQLLGEGGMGCVYRVRHRVLGRYFALKALRQELAYDQLTAERFVQEARAAAAISHPNVVTITDFGLLDSGQPYFVMELLEGRTLCSLMRERGVFSPKEALCVAREVASALAAAHDAGIIHRDLKPDNVVLLNPNYSLSQLKVLDFGLAMVHGNHRLTREGFVFGTPRYMSPEQASGESIDGRVDVYALGIVLYEMLTGRAPFDSDSYMGVLTKQLYAEPLPPSQVNQLLLAYPEIDDIVLRCLRKNREERFGSMQKLIQTLDSVLNLFGGPPSSDPIRSRLPSVRPPLDSRVRRRTRRFRFVAYAAIGALALGSALALLYGHWVSSDSGVGAPTINRSENSREPIRDDGVSRREDAVRGRVSAIAPNETLLGESPKENAPKSSPRLTGKNFQVKNRTGRSGGRDKGANGFERGSSDSAGSAKLKDSAKVESSEIPNPWAQ